MLYTHLQDLIQLFLVLYNDDTGLAAVCHIMACLWAVGGVDPSRKGTAKCQVLKMWFNKIIVCIFYPANMAPRLAITHSGELKPMIHTPLYSSTPSYR